MQKENNENKKKNLLNNGCAIALLLVSCFAFVFYSHRSNRLYFLLPALGLIIALSVLHYIWIKDKWSRFVARIIFLMVLVLFFEGLWELNSMYSNCQLNKYGTEVQAKVIDIATSENRHGVSYQAVIEYRFANTTYQQSIPDNQHIYKYGDGLLLKCSSHDPEIIEIVSHTSALK